MKSLELLAPAKNLECGIAAIDHGADAVYIGAPRFGARAAAGNSVEDIGELCRYAHQFGAKVYVTTNTIIFDDEIEETFRLIDELQQAGADALLVQDMAIVQEFRSSGVQEFRSSPLALHASTQTDNRTAEKVRWLRSQGFQRVVLARELSLEEIREIHQQVPDVELEVFVHGALCVSFSGQCYLSQYCQGRSANRGECAQMCRLKYDLVDADGREIEHQRHLLSLKDLCRIDDLEALADAGAVSFKIEGRLKDVDYVKNVVSAYSQRLDALCRKRPDDFQRSSQGRVTHFFTPNLKKTFNRGFTDYFLHCHRDEQGLLQGRQADIASFDTPKALGEYVGRVKEIRRDSFTVAGTAAFANGDGLCFLRSSGVREFTSPSTLHTSHSTLHPPRILEGFRVNRVEGNRLFPLKMPDGLRVGTMLYRNNDMAFEKLLSGKTAERKIPVRMTFREVENGFELSLDEGIGTREILKIEKIRAEKPQRENIVRQLTKLGNTPFVCDEIVIEGEADQYFIPSSQLAELRRRAISKITTRQSPKALFPTPKTPEKAPVSPVSRQFPYTLNVSNRLARDFYRLHGVEAAEAFENLFPNPVSEPSKSASAAKNAPLLMQCRHCLRYSLGHCVKHSGSKPEWREPLSLRLADGRQFRLEFDCRNCQMNVFAKEK